MILLVENTLPTLKTGSFPGVKNSILTSKNYIKVINAKTSLLNMSRCKSFRVIASLFFLHIHILW